MNNQKTDDEQHDYSRHLQVEESTSQDYQALSILDSVPIGPKEREQLKHKHQNERHNSIKQHLFSDDTILEQFEDNYNLHYSGLTTHSILKSKANQASDEQYNAIDRFAFQRTGLGNHECYVPKQILKF